MTIENLAVFLDQGVTTIIDGQQTLEQCLEDCRDRRLELEPLFRIALMLARTPIAPNPEHRSRARDQLISALRRNVQQDDAVDGPKSVALRRSPDPTQADVPAAPYQTLLDNLVLFPRLRLVAPGTTD